jgi:hypothetical protein
MIECENQVRYLAMTLHKLNRELHGACKVENETNQEWPTRGQRDVRPLATNLDNVLRCAGT